MPTSQISIASRIYWRIRNKGLRQDRFLRTGRGVIHVGANTGQERLLYARYGLKVAWIEPIPSVFADLRSNLADLPNQAAYNRLIAAQDGTKYIFHVANNGGRSSSILDLAEHREIWPDVGFSDAIELEATTLPSFIRDEHIDLECFDMLVLDTQGSELLVLQGAREILPRFRYIKSEVADFESYAGCCQLSEMNAFMSDHGFRQKSRVPLARSPRGGRYWDVLYQRI